MFGRRAGYALHRKTVSERGVTWASFDKDFGELARQSVREATYGVILFRTPMPRLGEVGRRLTDLITNRDDWSGHFSVVEIGRVRMRRLGPVRR